MKKRKKQPSLTDLVTEIHEEFDVDHLHKNTRSDSATINKRPMELIEYLGDDVEEAIVNKKSIENLEQHYLEDGQQQDDGGKIRKREAELHRGIHLISKTTPVSVHSTRVKPEAVDTGDKEGGKRVPLEYQVYLMLIKKFIFKCCKGRIYLYIRQYGYFKRVTDNELMVFIREHISNDIDKALNRHKLEEVVHRLKSCPNIQVESGEFDRHSHLINFRNGVFDTVTDQFQDHHPDYLFTSYIDADYEHHPREGRIFQKFLQNCTQGDELKIRSLQQLTGYAISNYSRAKRLFVIIGKPHTGKSVWLSIWRELVGVESTTAMTLKQLAENRFMQSRLAHSKLNVSPEMDENGPIKSTAFLKAVTGGDLISGDVKGEAPIDFYAKTTLIACGNHMPSFQQDGTSAFADRLLFIILNHVVPVEERDKTLLEKLMAERSYIVHWGLQGLRDLTRNNFLFTECKEGWKFKRQYIEELDHVPRFVRKMCIVDKTNYDLKVQRKHLFPAYLQYCRENCIQPVSKDELWRQIEKLGVRATKVRMYGSTGLAGFRGIKLKKEPVIELRNAATSAT